MYIQKYNQNLGDTKYGVMACRDFLFTGKCQWGDQCGFRHFTQIPTLSLIQASAIMYPLLCNHIKSITDKSPSGILDDRAVVPAQERLTNPHFTTHATSVPFFVKAEEVGVFSFNFILY